MTWESFRAKPGNLAEAKENVCSYANEMVRDNPSTKNRGNLLLLGEPGVGKTHLAVAVALEMIGQLTEVHFITGFKLLFEIKSTFDQRKYLGPTTEEILEAYSSYDYLIIDDLGAENVTPFALESLYYIVYERHIRELKTIVTSNLDLKALALRFGDRMISRLQENALIINMKAPDYRMKK